MTGVAAAGPRIALVGQPNCGKTSLFNLLTGARQKVANYAGVTVERKLGQFQTPTGRTVQVLDLPGTYALAPRSPDEAVTAAVLRGEMPGEPVPELIVCVLDATQLRRHLRFALRVRRMGLPMLVSLNMSDLARKRGLEISPDRLAAELGVPVVESVGVRGNGARALMQAIDAHCGAAARPAAVALDEAGVVAEADRILLALGVSRIEEDHASAAIDRVVLHPLVGPLLLAAVMFLVFQAVFAWSKPPMQWIQAGVDAAGTWLNGVLPESALRSLLVDGIVAGAGTVLVFLPQVLLLFFFILLLEDSGYLPRAAFLLDRLMGTVGLSGRSFIPLLSSFACAVPGIMATRTIPDRRDRWITIMIAPLMTCSARLPVYALLIGAFIPSRLIGPGIELQGLVLFALYVAGIVSAFLVSLVLTRTTRGQAAPLLMELPSYHTPNLRHLALGLLERARVFLRRVGTTILALMIVLWALSSFPAAPADATGPAIQYSIAGQLGALLEHVLEPVGFNWQISIALVSGLAAREVAVGALGTVYSMASAGEAGAALMPVIAAQWSLATGLAMLAWYVFAPQCLSTLAAVRRETGGWRAPVIMAAYLFALAYLAAFITYRAALALGA
ncbi:MAG TPA: ferrous iron transporter B [Burkholderiaceae bacterium]|nr:ferrous iron transporter B [Burkholderiaceae bacterium]HQR71515.1 ferrous iron transporter B [Burkholderiaceae bacterium]